MSDIFACTVRLSRVTIGNGTVGSGCCVVPTGLLLMVSNRAAMGRVKKSGFVEYALHSKTIIKSVPIVNVLFVIIVCCRNLEGIVRIEIQANARWKRLDRLTLDAFSAILALVDANLCARIGPSYSNGSKCRSAPSGD